MRRAICGAVAAVALAAGVGAAAADTVHVTQKTRYWSDNSVYYQYGPFRDANHCMGFAKSNAALAELFRVNHAVCASDGLSPSSPWRLDAPINIL